MMNFPESIKRRFGRYFSGAALVCLSLSFVLWYITKLGYTYTADLSIPVEVDGARIKVTCLVEATGYRLFAHRYLIDNTVDVTLEEVHATPSLVTRGGYSIDPFTLQNIISLRNGDLKVISLEDVPDVVLNSEK